MIKTQFCKRDLVVADKMKSLVERLTIAKGRQIDTDIESIEGIQDVKFVFCQAEACVLGKKELKK